MKVFLIRQNFAENCIYEKRLVSCCHFGENGKTIFSTDWPETFPAGNLLAFAAWYICSSLPEIKTIKAIADYKPLSYKSLDKGRLMEIEALTSQRFFVPETEGVMGKRNCLHDAVYDFIFREILKWSSEDLQLRLKEVLEFHLQGEFLRVERFYDGVLVKAVIPVLHNIISFFCRENPDFLRLQPLPFTRQPLKRMGICFPEGCFYECSGYGLHCFYLPDVQSSFFFHGSAVMSEIWYIFIRLLSETGYFPQEPLVYLERLEAQLLHYPWLDLEVSCI